MPSLSELKEIAEKGIKNEVDAISYMNYFNCDVTKAMIELCESIIAYRKEALAHGIWYSGMGCEFAEDVDDALTKFDDSGIIPRKIITTEEMKELYPEKQKPKFTDEQLDYLRQCANSAYAKRWHIGKDYFAALEEFIPYFIWSLKQEKSFEQLLDDADRDNYEQHPF